MCRPNTAIAPRPPQPPAFPPLVRPGPRRRNASSLSPFRTPAEAFGSWRPVGPPRTTAITRPFVPIAGNALRSFMRCLYYRLALFFSFVFTGYFNHISPNNISEYDSDFDEYTRICCIFCHCFKRVIPRWLVFFRSETEYPEHRPSTHLSFAATGLFP
jgi:hypothetical protein